MSSLKKGSEYLANWLKSPYLLAACVFYALMFVLGSIRILERFFIHAFSDKLLHFGVYLILTVLVYMGLKSRPIGEFFAHRVLWCWLIVSGMGAIDELAQFFVGRDPSFDDWLADTFAAIFTLMFITLGHGILWVWHWYRHSQDQGAD